MREGRALSSPDSYKTKVEKEKLLRHQELTLDEGGEGGAPAAPGVDAESTSQGREEDEERELVRGHR